MTRETEKAPPRRRQRAVRAKDGAIARSRACASRTRSASSIAEAGITKLDLARYYERDRRLRSCRTSRAGR